MSLLERAFHLAHQVFPEGGACFEFGVFRGSSYAYQAEQIKKYYPSSSIVGFDSWQGLPEETSGVWIPERHAKGEYAAPKDEVLRKLSMIGLEPDEKKFRLIDGFYSDSLRPELRETFDPLIFVNIDVDIYSSTIELLDFIEPMLRPGVILYWDDWRDPRDEHDGTWGEHKAWDDWKTDRTHLETTTIGSNTANQQVMIVTAVQGEKDRMSDTAIKEVHDRFKEFDTNPPELRKLPKNEARILSLKQRISAVPIVGPIVRAIYRAIR